MEEVVGHKGLKAKSYIWAGILLAFAPVASSARAFFNHDPHSNYRERLRPIQRSGVDLEARLVHAINGSRERVWVAVQELSLPDVAGALARAQARGVDVRVVLENSYSAEDPFHTSKSSPCPRATTAPSL